MIETQNTGQAIANTNYLDSEHAARWFFYLSWNVCAARLLVPDSQKPAVREIQREARRHAGSPVRFCRRLARVRGFLFPVPTFGFGLALGSLPGSTFLLIYEHCY